VNHILIALDFSEYSPEVEKVGYSIAQKINASVTLVCIINKFIDYMPADTGQVFENQWEARKEIAWKALQDVQAKHPDVSTEMVSFIGDPKEDIIDLSIKQHTTFIVIGTHGRTGMQHVLTGSTAEYIIRHAVVPIIVVPLRKTRH
jgi:nucleotide-binding universal stress UspA family protein